MPYNQAQFLRQILTGEDTFATTMLVWTIEQFGLESLQWHPLTLRMELEETNNLRLPKANFDKLMAAITIVTTDYFFKDVSRFVQLANILSGDDFQPDEFDPADSAECAWAVTEALLLSPPDEEDPEPFSDDVRRYLGIVLKEEGYVTPPDVLRLAIGADFTEQVRYDFTDDPEMFQAIHEVQQDKTKDVENLIRANLSGLLGQLQALPLREGSTTELVTRLRSNLQAKMPELALR